MYLMLSVFTGMLFIMVKTINMLLSKEVGIYKSNIVNHFTGLTTSFLFVLVGVQISQFTISGALSGGLFPLMGGLMGATFVTLSNFTFSKTKVLTSTLLILLGQTLSSILMDYLFFDSRISTNAILGTGLMVTAVILYNKPPKKVNSTSTF